MTVEQLDLAGGVHIVGVTDRQSDALLFVERMCGVALDELGAFMCERRGKHQQDSRCNWCLDNGSAVAHELHAKGLLERRRGGWFSTRTLDTGSVSEAAAAAGPVSSGPDPSSHPLRARSTDPSTSHEAAASVVDLTGKQHAVLAVFHRHGAMHDEDLLNAYDVAPDVPEQSDSGLRTRRHELVEQGLLEDSGRRASTEAGRQSIIWRITDRGRARLGVYDPASAALPF